MIVQRKMHFKVKLTHCYFYCCVVQDYMQMLGQYTPTQDLQTRRSINSINFYQEEWFRHQMEFFPYPRSQTVSIMSNVSSSANSDVFSITSASSSEDTQVAPLPALSENSLSTSSAAPPLLPPKRKVRQVLLLLKLKPGLVINCSVISNSV